MAITVERVAREYFNVLAGVEISVPVPLYAESDVIVYFGNAGYVAVPDIDYTVALDKPNFDTFTLTPTVSLIGKIDAAILADPTEQNVIVVRRVVNMLTDASPGNVSSASFSSREFDVMAMRFQQLNEQLNRTISYRGNVIADAPLLHLGDTTPGTAFVLDLDGYTVRSGPTIDAINEAATKAADAGAYATVALLAADRAEAAENTILKPRGQWLTALAYSVGDTVYQLGSQYESLVAHTSGVFANDLADNKWRVFVAKGDAGVGSGDVRISNSGSEYTPQASTFRANLALALSAYTPLATQDMETWTGGSGGLMNAGTGLTNIPVGAAVGDRFIFKTEDDDNRFFCWFFQNGDIATRHKNGGVWGPWVRIASEAFVAEQQRILHIQEVFPPNVSAGASSAYAFVTRPLNTIRTNTIPGASLASNTITLPAGTYECTSRAPAYLVGINQTQLYDTTNSVVLVQGGAVVSANADRVSSNCFADGRFTLAGVTDIILRHKCELTVAGWGLGVRGGFAMEEVYADVKIRKLI